MHCTMCQTTLGDSVKVQPTTVDGTTFCPPCFTVRRIHDEPERFNASQMAAIRCMLCGWMTVSFGVYPGMRRRCGQCGQLAGIQLRLDEMPFTKGETAVIEELARESGIKQPPRVGRRG